jgi:hypothetical protein
MIDPISSAISSALGAQKPASTDDGLLDVTQRLFRLALFEALAKASSAAKSTPAAQAASPALLAPTVAPSAAPPLPPPLPPIAAAFRSATLPVDERQVIRRTAERAGIDPALLQALRRAENGGPGREFGVLSVPAPTYDDQARVAAETIRRNVERFEQRGGQALDPASGRYTKEFIEFFSSRYAPVGASNDPSGLNRHHAGNLVRLYAQAASSA